MRKVLFVLTLLVLSLTLMACGEKIDRENSIIVGLEVDYPPFNWAEQSPSETNVKVYGQKNMYADGYDVQVAKYLAEKLDKKLYIKQVEWESLIEALVNGEIDLIIAGMSPTDNRKITIDFTEQYYTSNHVLVVLKDGPLANFTELDELKGYRGVGQIETIYADLVDQVGELHGANVLPVRDNVPLITTDILNDVADFTIVEKPVALGMVKAHPSLKIIFDVEDNIFNVSDSDREVSIGIRKADTNLRNQINQILSTITPEMRKAWMDEAVLRHED